MALRTDYPNTGGAWVTAPGYPLVEIKSDGSGISVQSRPAGGRALSQLSEGERLAYQYQSQAYFFGEAAAQAEKENLTRWHNVQAVSTNAGTLTVGKDEIPPWIQKSIDEQNAQSAKDQADALAALSTGSYRTPAPAPPGYTGSNDAPPATPLVTSATHAAVVNAQNTATGPIAGPLNPPAVQLVPSTAGSSSSGWLLFLLALLVGAAWYFHRGGAS